MIDLLLGYRLISRINSVNIIPYAYIRIVYIYKSDIHTYIYIWTNFDPQPVQLNLGQLGLHIKPTRAN